MYIAEFLKSVAVIVNVNVNVNLESQPRVPTKFGRCSWLSYYGHVYWEDSWFRNSGCVSNFEFY